MVPPYVEVVHLKNVLTPYFSCNKNINLESILDEHVFMYNQFYMGKIEFAIYPILAETDPLSSRTQMIFCFGPFLLLDVVLQFFVIFCILGVAQGLPLSQLSRLSLHMEHAGGSVSFVLRS